MKKEQVKVLINSKIKKHELLKYAYDNYPKGTIARFPSAKNTDHISDGIFKILDINHSGNTDIFSGEGLNCFYISHDEEGDFIGQWAEVVTKPEEEKVLLSDGTSIKYGDAVYIVIKRLNGYELDTHQSPYKTDGDKTKFILSENTLNGDVEYTSSTKEAALKWIEEMNKPKSIEIYDKSTLIGHVDINGFNCIWGRTYDLTTEMIDDLYCASQKLINQ